MEVLSTAHGKRKRYERSSSSDDSSESSREFRTTNKRMRLSRISERCSSPLSDSPGCSYSEESVPSTESENDDNVKDILEDSQTGELTPHSIGTYHMKSSLTQKTNMTKKISASTRPLPIPNMSWTDTSELAQLICFKEDIMVKNRDQDVFRKHSNLTPRMRAILFDWLMEVCDVYKLRRITYYLAIDFVDRYLSKVNELPKNQLQLLGITCLLIAAKVEEIYPPKLLELSYVTDGACTDREMQMKEIAILKTLKWDVTPMTVSSWLNLYMQTNVIKEADRDLDTPFIHQDDFIFPQYSTYAFMKASQLLDLCSLDDGMLKFSYSVLAASAIYYIYNRERALFASGFTWDKISKCVEWMAPFAEVINKVNVYIPVVDHMRDNSRNGSGLRKTNKNIVLDELHTLQTHAVDLKLLESVHKLQEERESIKPGISSDEGGYVAPVSCDSDSDDTDDAYGVN